MFKALKLGGCFQHLKPNIHLRCENAARWPRTPNEIMRTFTQWADLFYDAGDEIGRTFRVCDGILEESAKKAGFKKIVHKEYTIPIAG
ncbi:hypothetical protein CEP52_016540 [Fusarium oligoseptatum]|uniref:Methyltransferase n=1 Tax=Fusarium oligoseptatum TaxID=2604345 RepID=A0A428S2L8_9HYPO|nr:hypothetical protein CEP52_016540 [Fusarium oligoseptatum]